VRDIDAARAEIRDLTGLARGALGGMRAVTTDEHAVTLRTEADGALALAAAADIDAHVDVDLPVLAPAVEGVLARAVREGMTNVLRHSRARACWITGGRRDGHVWLEIENDGAQAPMEEGSGLGALAERARALSGTLTAGPAGDGRFRLRV